MSGFRDIHAHFVYGLDDGAQTERDMQAMLDVAHKDGIAILYATPHVVPGVQPFDEALFDERLELARAYCEQQGYQMMLRKGAEILYTPALRQVLPERRMITLDDTNTILMEFTPQIDLAEVENALDMLEQHGYVAILAHVERYRCFYHGRNAYRLKKAHDVQYQVNCSTVIDGKGFLRDRTINRWLRGGLIDYVATDTHDCHRRPSRMTRAYEVLEQSVGQTYAKRVTGCE